MDFLECQNLSYGQGELPRLTFNTVEVAKILGLSQRTLRGESIGMYTVPKGVKPIRIGIGCTG